MGVATNSAFYQALVQSDPDFLENALAGGPKRNFQVRFWDGRIWGCDQAPRFTLILNHPKAISEMFFSPNELSLGEAYIFDDIDIEGDIEAAFDLADYLLDGNGHPSGFPSLNTLLRKPHETRHAIRTHQPNALRGTVHSRDRDCQSVRYHYDLPPEFFKLWLDSRMLYSCAYFIEGQENDLETAQFRKMDYICRKLHLKCGDLLLDVGCGWGGLLVHAATHYGVQAVGITLSLRQAEVARQRIREMDLNDQCRVEVCDYRDLELGRQVDKIVSVGMFEHVGEQQLPEYLSRAWRLLGPGGTFLNAGISASATFHRQGPSFINRYVFPDGQLVPISTTLAAAERSRFEVRDVESLREHYVLTLHHWVHRLEAHAEAARRITDETTYQIWRLYMAASAHGFRSNRMNLHQTLLVKALHGESGMPRTRADWYRD